MFLVKTRSELLRFSLFLVIISALAYYIATHMGSWLKATPDQEPQSEEPVSASLLELAQELAPGADAGAAFFAAYRIDRDRARAELRETLREVMASASADEATRHEANRRYLAMAQNAALERSAENALRARGFDDAIVEIGDAAVQVIVKAAALDKAGAAQVTDIVAGVAGVKPQQIRIIPRGQ